jgi:hypothetical protein
MRTKNNRGHIEHVDAWLDEFFRSVNGYTREDTYEIMWTIQLLVSRELKKRTKGKEEYK